MNETDQLGGVKAFGGAATIGAIVVAFSAALGTFFFPTLAFAEAGDELLSAGLEAHGSGKYQEAITTFDRFIATYPTSKSRNKAELFDGHSHLSLAAGDPSETAKARKHFNYIASQGKNAEYYKEATFHDAYSYFDLRQYAEAEPLFEAFLGDFPKDAYVQYVYYYLGVCAARSGNYPKAISYFDKNLTEYPNSPLRWTCRLEKAATTGKSGDFAGAERQLAQLAAEPDVPSDVAGRVGIQRALLQISQRQYDAAIQTLEEFIVRYQNDASAVEVVQDAYLYEAYSYFAKKECERALLIVEATERASATIPPEFALLKIKLLINLKRVDEAEALLDKLAASSYGTERPDSIVSERAVISLARGDWDAAISKLVDLLKVRRSPSDPNAVVVDYYETAAPDGTTKRLEPYDFVGACGVLALSYASRYAAKKNPEDATAQAAVFKATTDYAAKRDDPGLDLIVSAVDSRRRQALSQPLSAATGDVSFAAPTVDGSGSGVGAAGPNGVFRDPTNPNAGSAAQTTGANYAPNDSNVADPNGQSVAGPGAAASPGEAAGDEPTPLTPEAAREALDRATTRYVNREYARANEILLQTITSSETFWKDCPAEAARIALLRANALFALDMRSEAELTCKDLLDEAPFSPEAAVANFYLGYGADYFGRRDEAIKYLRQAVSAKNESPFTDVALYCLGMNEWERRDVEGAERTFSRLYRFYPQSAYWSHAAWALAKIESDARNDVVAEELVNEALRKKPDAAIVDYLLFLKGEIALRAKDYDKAQIAFGMIVEQYPDGIWYSKAKNRLAAVPARFRNADFGAVVDGARAASATNGGFDASEKSATTSSNERGSDSAPTRRPNPPNGLPRYSGSGSDRNLENFDPSRVRNAAPGRTNPNSSPSGVVETPRRQASVDGRRVYELSFSGDAIRL